MSRWLAVIALAGCSDDVSAFEPHFELGSCGVVDVYDEDPGIHVAQGTIVDYSTNPPTSGMHYGVWAAYDCTYPSLQRELWMHDAEHGAIVLLHRCDPAACPEVVAQLEEVVRAFPADPMCAVPVRQRALVVFDPLLPQGVEIAAVAWGKAYTATCVDPVALATFHRDFYSRAPENTCASGASLGGTPIE